MAERDIRTYEVTFCSRVSKWADSIFEDNLALSFKRTEIEESKGIKRKRSDLRVYGKSGRRKGGNGTCRVAAILAGSRQATS